MSRHPRACAITLCQSVQCSISSPAAFGTKCSIPNILWRDACWLAAKLLISHDFGIASVPRVRISSRPPTASPLTFSRPFDVARIATFCGPFAAKLCTFAAYKYVARAFSGSLFSRPPDYGNLVRKLQRFLAGSNPYFWNFSRGTEKTSALTGALILRCIFCGEVRS
jgi:hypothetical protein